MVVREGSKRGCRDGEAFCGAERKNERESERASIGESVSDVKYYTLCSWGNAT